uniref:small monomeric GTPase n=1 Tax=Cyprinus carpio carpio TaxID=630221 RepID=A0A9J7YI43_CYPCA
MGSTRRPLKGNKGQRKEKEHHDENESLECEGIISVEKKTFSLEDESSTNASPLRTTKDGVKQQEMELCEENDVGPVEGSESALLQSSCSSDLLSEDSTTVSICHVTELQTLMKLNEESQENAGDAEKLATEEDKDLQLKNESQNKMFDSTTSEAEGKEENISDVSVTLLREVEVNRDTGTVESNMTTESDFLQTSPDAHIEALKISEIAEKVPGETDTILKQSDISIIPQDSHREEAHSKSSPVIHKRKMGSTRRPLKGNKGQREEHDEKEIFSLEDEPSPDESRHTAVNVCDISESQTFSKIHAGSQENTGDVEIVSADGDTELHLENKTFDSTAFREEATEENICEASVLVKEVEFIGDTVTVDSNMTTESDLIQNDTSSDAKPEALKVSDNAECEVQEETDAVPKQSDTTIIPEDIQREESHSEFTVIHKRKMGSTRRPLRGKNAQRKEKEHLDENETPDSEGIINVEEETISLENEPSTNASPLRTSKNGVKEQEMELCEENDVGPVEGSESAFLQSSCSSDLLSEESTAVSICHVTESQTLMKLNEESQENAGDAEKLAAEEEKDLKLKTESQNKIFDSTTSEAEGTEENISDVSVTLLREVEVNRDTGTLESNMTTESNFLQTSPDAHIEALKISENAEKEVSGETDTILQQSDISIIPDDSHREEAHSKSSPVIHKRKMGSTRRPLKGNKGQRPEHDEKEIFSLEDEPSPHESRNTAVNVCDISELQTLPKIHAGSQENTGDVEIVSADGDTERHLENKTFDSTTFGGEATEENICEASVLVKEVEFIGDTVTVDSNMTTESDLIQNDTSSDAKLEALKVSDNAECEVQEETDAVPKQSDTTIIPEDTQREEAHSEFTVIHKRKMGSTRRPLRGKNAQRKEKEHLDENETPDSEGIINVEEETISLKNEPSTNASTLRTSKDVFKEQEMELCEENDVGPVEGSESALLQSSFSSDLLSEESTAVSICHITELQTLVNLNEESQKNAGDAEKLAAEDDKDLQLKTESQNKMFDSTTSEAEGTEKNISDVSVTLLREVEVNRDTGTVESNMTTESDFLQTSPDAHIEALKISENAEKEVSRGTDTILQQNDISIIPEDSHREDAHSKSSPVIHKRKMGSTRRPLKGNKEQRPEHDEKEIFSLEDESSPDESRHTAVNVCDISESQTFPKIHAGSQENTGDVEIVSADGDTERHLENKTFDSTAFGGEATEENICEASVLVKEVEFIGDTVTVDSNMTTESDLIQNDTSSDAKLEALKVSDNAECEVQKETDAVPKQSDTTIIPEDTQREEAHSEFTVIHKRKMGSTRRPLRGKNAQRKEKEHLDENEKPDSEGIINVEEETIRLENEPSLDESTLQSLKVGLKEQEIEICEKNDVGPVEGSESALLQSSCSSDLLSEESTAVSICHVTELQTLVNLNEESQENAGVAEKLAAEEDKDLQLKTESQNKMFDSTTSEAEGTEENISDVSVTLLREVEVIGDTGTVESNMTTESDFLQTSPDAHIEALKISENAEKEVSRGTDTILKQSDISIFPQDSHREEAHSKSSPVIHKRKMGSTRRPLKGNKGQRLEDEPSPNESRYSAVNVCDISESQILPKIHVGSQENTGDVEIVSADGDTERHLENKTFDSTAFGGEATEENICEASVLVKEVKFIGDTVTVDSNMTTESDLIQNDTSSDAKLEALKVSDNAECEVQEETDTVPKQSDTTIIPEDIQREEAHSEFTVIHKRKMGSTRRPLRGKNAQRKEKEHLDENETPDSEGSINVVKETISLEDEPSLDESTLQSLKDGVKEQEIEICEKNDVGPVEGSKSTDLQSLCSSDLTSEESTVISICHITESQTLMKLNEESQDNAGDAERVAVGGETDLHLEIKAQIQTSDSTSEAEATEENTHDASVLVRKIEIIGDTVTVDSNMTTESDFIQNYTSSDAKLEALKVSDNAECEVQEETDAVPKQSDTTIIPEETQREEAHSEFTVIHKRKMGSTRRPLRGKNAQRKENEHLDENETPDSEGSINVEKETISLEDEPSLDESTLQSLKDGVKEQEMEICEKNDVGPVEGSKSTDLQSLCSSDLTSEESTVISICHITESQTLMKLNEESQDNDGYAERVAVGGETDLHVEIKAQVKTSDSTSEAEATEENICEASALVKEVEFIGDTVTVESNITTESDFLQSSPDSLKVSQNSVKEVSGETDTILKQSDISIIPEDSHREEAHSKSSPVIHKRKMGSTRRPLKGNKGKRKDHDEKEIFSLEDEPSPDESRHTAVNVCDISESQTFPKIHAGSQKNTGDVEIAPAEGDTEQHLENKTFDSTAFGGEATEENICEASVLVKEVEFIGDTVTVESNITTESVFIQSSPDALKVSQNSAKEVLGETDTILKQSNISIIPEDSHREEAHSKSSPVIHKRKMGSTRRPLKGKNGQRNEKEHHDENETPDSEHMFNVEKETISLEDQPMYTAVSDILESQTLTKFHAESQEDYKDVERALVGRDTEPRSVQTEMTTLNSATFEGEGTEEIICEASVVVKEIEFIGDTVSMESNMTIKSDLLQSDISTDAKPEALMSEIENEGKTDTIPKQSDTNIIPEVPHGEEVHTKLNLNVQKRKMGSTCRPLRGNKGQRKVRVESEEKNGNSEPLSEEEDTETHLEIQNQDNVVDHNVTQEFLNIRDNKDEERKTTKTVEELCDDLKLEQRSDVSQTQSGPSQDDTGSHLLEVPERTADFVIDRFAGRSHSDLFLSDALLAEETQIHVSSEDVLPTEMAEMHPVSKRSMQKRKMGSTRKRGKRMVNDEEVEEEKDGEAENTTNEDGTTKSEENLTVEEAIVGSPVPQQLFSSSADKESHEIQDIVSKSDVQTDISEQNDPNSTINPELSIEFECYSNVAAEMVSDLPLGDADTYLGQKQSVIPKESHREDQSSLNPIVQKRKMGSTRKTLRGNKGLGKEEESKKMDRESEEMTQEQDTEPHLATSERKTASKFDEEVEQNFPVEFPYPVAFSKMFPESENGGKEVSLNIHDLSEVSEEKESTGNDSNSENEAINLYDGTKDKFVLTVSHKEVDQTVSVDVYVGSEPEQTENTGHVFPTQELKSTQDDVVHEISSTQEKRRKMGSTRRNPRVIHGENMADNEDVLGVAEDRETKKAEDDLDDMLLESSIIQSKEVSSVSTTDLESEILGSATDLKEENHHQNNSEPSGPTVPETLQLVNADVTKHPQSETVTTENRRKMGSTRKNLREGRIQGKRDGYEETETADTNLQMSQDSEMSLGDQTTHDYFNQPEDSLLSEIERALNKTSQSSMSNDRESVIKEPNHISNAPDLSMPENSEIKSLQPTPLAHSEPNSPGRRRKMGSTRKNPRQQLKAEREDEDKEDEEKDENLKTNKQENKDLERVEVSIIPNITENKLNKEYLDVSSAHTSSSELEESTNPVSQERTSPSTKRKFGSRRTNKGKKGLGSLATSDFGNELEDGDHKLDISEVEDKLCSDDSEVCDPCLTLQPENQPITHPVSEQRNMEVKNEEVAAKGTVDDPVSSEQIIKHDRSTGAKQAVNLKNRISDAEVVQFNVVMVGNSSVGKTSFIRRFHEGQFTEDYRSTIGVDTCIQTIDLPDRTVKLQIWDTAGQERFHSITSQVFHRADGLLLMYEITCSNSFISVRDWISQAQERAPDDVIMMLLGNKNDSLERAVQIQEGADLAREYNINFMECSAATGANVSESMRTLAELLVQRKSEKERHTTLKREPSQKKSGCC